MAEDRRVIHKGHGAGYVRQYVFIGPASVDLVKFDSQEEEVFVPERELSPEIKEIKKDDKAKKDFEKIRNEGIKEAKEIEEMSDRTFVEAFELLIRSGAGPGIRRVVFMKREMLKRMKTEKKEKEECRDGI